MTHTPHDVGVSRHLGSYSDAVETASGLRWLHTSGTPGIDGEGRLPPDIARQSRIAWANVLSALERAGMGLGDIVKVNTSLVDAAHIPEYVRVRKEILGEVRPAFMLSVVSGMVRPDILVEIEVVAAAR